MKKDLLVHRVANSLVYELNEILNKLLNQDNKIQLTRLITFDTDILCEINYFMLYLLICDKKPNILTHSISVILFSFCVLVSSGLRIRAYLSVKSSVKLTARIVCCIAVIFNIHSILHFLLWNPSRLMRTL